MFLGISQKSCRRSPEGCVTQDTMSARGLGQAASTSALRRMGTSRHCLPVSYLYLFCVYSFTFSIFLHSAYFLRCNLLDNKTYRAKALCFAVLLYNLSVNSSCFAIALHHISESISFIIQSHSMQHLCYPMR